MIKLNIFASGLFCPVCCVGHGAVVRSGLNKSISYNARDQRSQSQPEFSECKPIIIDNTKFCHVKFSSKYNLSSWNFLFTWANNPQSLSWWCDIEAAANLLGHQTPDTSWWWGPHNNHSPPPAPDTDNTCWQPLGPGVCTPWGYWWPWLTVNHSITLAEVFTNRRKVKVNWWSSDLARMGLSYSNSVSV